MLGYAPLSQLGEQRGMWSTSFQHDLDIVKPDNTLFQDYGPTEIRKIKNKETMLISATLLCTYEIKFMNEHKYWVTKLRIYTKFAASSSRYSEAIWTEIDEWRPEINLYSIFSSWHNSSAGSVYQNTNE